MPGKVKLYNSQTWLTYQYQTLKKTAAQIAKEQSVTEVTIYLKLKEFNLIKNPRKLSR